MIKSTFPFKNQTIYFFDRHNTFADIKVKLSRQYKENHRNQGESIISKR